MQCPPSKRRACSSKDGLSLPSRWLRHPLPNQEDAMTKTPFIWAAILTASLGAPALAQMGGSMMGGGSGGDSSTPFKRGKMSSGDQTQRTKCQEITPEAKAEDKKCRHIKKKGEQAETETNGGSKTDRQWGEDRGGQEAYNGGDGENSK